jgi:hypothetical protein
MGPLFYLLVQFLDTCNRMVSSNHFMRINMKSARILLFLIFLIMFTSGSYAQIELNENSKEEIRNLAEKLEQKLRQQKSEALQHAQAKGYVVRALMRSGKLVELMKVMDGFPLYYATDNMIAAQTVSTDLVWSQGYTGSGMLVGEWDGGDVRTSHQELSGRVVDGDGITSMVPHSTQVAGVLIASGVNSNARGMAPAATLHAYDWNQDVAEMAAAAANDGLLLSNHSYGVITGWSYGDFFGMGEANWYWFGDVDVDVNESVYFGWYGGEAETIDDLAFTAPYYLMVYAAGNDRGEGPGAAVDHYAWSSTLGAWVWFESVSRPVNGAYDCLSGASVAKNILVVGAVDDIPGGYTQVSDVVMTSFSCWGPVDDGRIKPDLVGNGVELWTSHSNTDASYALGTGTSFAAPNVTGSLVLLQEYYHSSHNPDWMKSATLKALSIHTADEAGTNSGPDYQFGWGLLNTQSAYDHIQKDISQDHHIQEHSLNDGESISLSYYAPGNEDIRVTMVWTDPAATPVDPLQLDNPSPVLINDLDITLQNGATQYMPWVLDKDNPSNAATTGDNTVDNVEQVFISNPDAGVYTLQISHKGTLENGSQDFSLVLSGLYEADFGDAPDSPYPTLFSNNGACHQLDDQTYLGLHVDAELDASPDAHSLGDDRAGTSDDEDGIVFDSALVPGTTANITVTASVAGKLNAWIDFDLNGVWDGDEQIFTDEDLVSGANTKTFTVPADAVLDITFARFRFNLSGGLLTTGNASEGEVEDYQVSIQSGGEPDFDLDGIPNTVEGESDRDNDGVPNNLDYDPTGYFYDQSSGEIIAGGQITVDPSSPVTIAEDGSEGFYQFYTDGTPGTYTLQIILPPDYELSTTCLASMGSFDPTGLSNPAVLGAGENDDTGFIGDYDCADNIYYFSFDLAAGDPVIINNNIPLNYLIPIELSSFTAECVNGTVELQWITQSETENMGFYLFRAESQSGNYQRITSTLIPGQGNSQSVNRYEYTDQNVENGQTYYYQLADIDFHGRMTKHKAVNVTVEQPEAFSLRQNYPNPFNPETVIEYSLSGSGDCDLIIYNINGQVVRTLVSEYQQAGSYKVIWNGRDDSGSILPSGVYLYKLVFNQLVETRKMHFLK